MSMTSDPFSAEILVPNTEADLAELRPTVLQAEAMGVSDLVALQGVMLTELHHRVKNLFAIVDSILRLAAKDAHDIPSFVESCRARIGALARSHAISQTQQDNGDIDLDRLLESLLGAYAPLGLQLKADAVVLPGRLSVPLGLILHEWATNAVKYGALGAQDGEVKLVAECRGQEIFLRWEENLNSPVASAITVRGFGSAMVEIAAAQLEARLSSVLYSSGFVGELQFRL